MPKKKTILTLKDSAKYLNLRQNTLYVYTCKKKIPFSKEGTDKNNRITFNTNDLDKWLTEKAIKKYCSIRRDKNAIKKPQNHFKAYY